MSGFPMPDWWNATARAIVIVGIALGMVRVHEAGVIVGVLDANYIFLDQEHHIRLSGFQWAQLQTERHPGGPFQGPTSHYVAPGLSGGGRVTPSADVFGFGLILYQVVAKDLSVFNSVSGVDVARRLVGGVRPELEKSIPAVTRELIERCWRRGFQCTTHF